MSQSEPTPPTNMATINEKLDLILLIFTQLQNSVNTLQTDVNALQTDVNTLQTDVNTLQTDVNALQTDVTALQTDVNPLQTDVNPLQTNQQNIQTACMWLMGAFNALHTNQRALAAAVGTIVSCGCPNNNNIPPQITIVPLPNVNDQNIQMETAINND